MKIRNGFVSNSSSSSFVLIGKPISLNELDSIKDPKDYIFLGKDLYCNGLDIFQLSDASLACIKKHKYNIKHAIHIYKITKYLEEAYEIPCKDFIIGPDSYIHVGQTAQQSGFISEEVFIKRYCTLGDDDE